MQAPSVIGELLAGVILGPSLLGWIEPFEAIKLMAEIGIILLLFEVGLETDVKRLVRTGIKSFVVAMIGFVLPLVLGFSLGYWVFNQPLLVSLFIGGTLTATSIGITVRVLSDLKRQQAPEGQIVLGAAVLDDVMGVVLLALLYEFSIGGGVSILNTGQGADFRGCVFRAGTCGRQADLTGYQAFRCGQRNPRFNSYQHCVPGTFLCLAGSCAGSTGIAWRFCCRTSFIKTIFSASGHCSAYR